MLWTCIMYETPIWDLDMPDFTQTMDSAWSRTHFQLHNSVNRDQIFFFPFSWHKNQQKLCLIKSVLLRKTNILHHSSLLRVTGLDQFQLNAKSTGCSFSRKRSNNVPVLHRRCNLYPGDTLSIVTEQPAGSQKSDSHKPRLILPPAQVKIPHLCWALKSPTFHYHGVLQRWREKKKIANKCALCIVYTGDAFQLYYMPKCACARCGSKNQTKDGSRIVLLPRN